MLNTDSYFIQITKASYTRGEMHTQNFEKWIIFKQGKMNSILIRL